MRNRRLTVDDFGIATQRFFVPARTAGELLAARDAIAVWQRSNDGWMRRSPVVLAEPCGGHFRSRLRALSDCAHLYGLGAGYLD